jgi:hypothetical protein
MKHLPTGNAISTFSNRFRRAQHWVLSPQAQEYAAVIPTKYKEVDSWAKCIVRFIQIVKQMTKMNAVPVRAIIGLVHLLRDNAASSSINSVWLLNIHVD